MIERDQTIKADAGKRRLTLVPLEIIEDIAEVREYGLKKYGSSESWQSVEIERYRDSSFRHFLAYLRDPDGVDEESGIKHYKMWACNCAFLCALERKRQQNAKREKDVRTCRKDKQKMSHLRKTYDIATSKRSDTILRRVRKLFKRCG